jgi:hypothetical protein
MVLGDNTTQQVGQGDMSIKLNNGPIKEKVLHVLGFEKNLFFVEQLDHVKGKITIKFSNCKSLKGIEIVQCIFEVDIYKLGVNNKQKCSETTFPIIIDLNKTNLWHLGLGHINQRRLKKIQSMSKGV